tara:strand:- start:146 stop:253 length:108 start_codon:yes stop_codon:yes gene_type:complete
MAFYFWPKHFRALAKKQITQFTGIIFLNCSEGEKL